MSNQFHFKEQFQEFDYEETIPVDNSVTNFRPISLDIGWQLEKSFGITRKKTNDKYLKKFCLGTVYCGNAEYENGEPCALYSKEVRPASTKALIKEQKCIHCSQLVVHANCDVMVEYTLKKNYDIATGVTTTTCSVKSTGIHLHAKVVAKHLTPNEKEELTKRVINEPTKTPSKFMNGIQLSTGELDTPLYEISPILSNQGRARYELQKVYKEFDINKKTEFLGELGKIQAAFKDNIIFSQVSLKSEFIIAFTSPALKKEQIRFDKFPIVTDVTYKAVASDKNKYLCSSVIYVHGLSRSIVIFQAVIGGLDAKHFAVYFIKLFTTFNINKHRFLGMVMDFSAADINRLDWLSTKAILTSLNKDVFRINDRLLDRFPGQEREYLSSDTLSQDEEQMVYPVEFLNTIQSGGIPDHKLKVKLGCPLILLRNLDPAKGLCNGTRLVCRSIRRHLIEVTIATGAYANTHHLIPRIDICPTDTQSPVSFSRRQFPLRLAFCMTINKSQGQTLDRVGLYLPASVFSHGQLYVSFSRVKSPDSIKILTTDSLARIDNLDGFYTGNIVYNEVF